LPLKNSLAGESACPTRFHQEFFSTLLEVSNLEQTLGALSLTM
jgi:hypothetical protein